MNRLRPLLFALGLSSLPLGLLFTIAAQDGSPLALRKPDACCPGRVSRLVAGRWQCKRHSVWQWRPQEWASFASGLVGRAFSFDGINGFVDVPDAPALHAVTTAVTVDAWINPQPDSGWFFARRDPLVSEGISMEANGDGYLTTTLQKHKAIHFNCFPCNPHLITMQATLHRSVVSARP